MKKRLRIFATLALCFSIMANCLPAKAAVSACIHPDRFLVERILKTGREIDKHDVILISNGLSATCHIYQYGYDEKWHCRICGNDIYKSDTSIEHSLEGLYYKK